MKKLLLAILAVLYLGTSTGAAFHLHYCMGKLTDWTLSRNTSKTCGKCGMEKSEKKRNSCCADEQKIIKNNLDQKTNEANIQINKSAVSVLPSSFFELPSIIISQVALEYPVSNGPPRTNPVAVYILNRSFLI